MYIAEIPNRSSPPAILLRESYREGNKTRQRTLANLSALPSDAIAALRAVLKGKTLVDPKEAFTIDSSLPSGHVSAVKLAMERLGMRDLVASKPCPEREIVLAMIAQRIIQPGSKLATVSLFEDTTLGSEFGMSGVDEDDLYDALDWLNKRQVFIENKLAKRHLHKGSRVLYDLSSSSYYGSHCPLAKYGYNRDGLKLPSIAYGLMTNRLGCPISITAYSGNTSDSKTVLEQATKTRDRFGIDQFTLVGDRGMLTKAIILELSKLPGCGWITCLRSADVRELILDGQDEYMPLFRQRNFAEISHPDYPGERLVVCYNPLLAEERARKRTDLLAATEEKLHKIKAEVARRTKKLLSADQIGLKVGKVINKYKMAKHFHLEIDDDHFDWQRIEENIERETSLDGYYILRTSEPAAVIEADEVIRAYKDLGNVERAFRSIKGIDLQIRPIYHRLDNRVRAHIFLCMLAYYVEWHMRRALAPLLYADEDIEQARASRDPVIKPEPTRNQSRKRSSKLSEDGFKLRTWDGLLKGMSTIVQNKCTIGEGRASVNFHQYTKPSDWQKRVFDLLKEMEPISRT